MDNCYLFVNRLGNFTDSWKNLPGKTSHFSILNAFFILLIALGSTSCHTTQPELKSAEEYYNRGQSNVEKEDLDRAISDFDHAIELKPDYADAYFYRGELYFVKGDWDRAISDYTQVIQLTPDDVGIYNTRGIAYCKKGDFDLAIRDFDQAIQLQADYAPAYYNRGLVYESKSDIHQAILDVQKAYELCGDSSLCEKAKQELETLWINRSFDD